LEADAESCSNYVNQFKYLGHIVMYGMTDDEDIEREIKNMFIRTNPVTRNLKGLPSQSKLLNLNHIVFVFTIQLHGKLLKLVL